MMKWDGRMDDGRMERGGRRLNVSKFENRRVMKWGTSNQSSTEYGVRGSGNGNGNGLN